ncbi:MAG: hypothetical protein ACXWLL_03785, partial [Myxococcaceae bacterium]
MRRENYASRERELGDLNVLEVELTHQHPDPPSRRLLRGRGSLHVHADAPETEVVHADLAVTDPEVAHRDVGKRN